MELQSTTKPFMEYFIMLKSIHSCSLPAHEMESVTQFDELPDDWTYPEIQPKLLAKAISYLHLCG